MKFLKRPFNKCSNNTIMFFEKMNRYVNVMDFVYFILETQHITHLPRKVQITKLTSASVNTPLKCSFSKSWRLKEWSTDLPQAKSCIISPLRSIRTLWWLFHSWLTYTSTSQHLPWKAGLVSRCVSVAFTSLSWHWALELLFPDGG